MKCATKQTTKFWVYAGKSNGETATITSDAPDRKRWRVLTSAPDKHTTNKKINHITNKKLLSYQKFPKSRHCRIFATA